MTDQLVSYLQQFLLAIFGYKWIVVVLLAFLPIVEARLAIPMAISYGYTGLMPFVLGFVGSTLIAPLLLLVLMPLIRWLMKTKLFKRLGEVVYEKFRKKSEKMDGKSSDLKKMFWLCLFVAIPLPLTGIWTGCAVASFIGLRYDKSLVSIVAGNLIACTIISVLCALFPANIINYIITIIGIIAVIVVIALIVKAIVHRPDREKTDE